ncbi:lysophospholipid acyltransferase family protein [Williamsia sp. 1135]|uniref:lysophospholipid acyltransferase family protein n=1 Tax=Williamsia sp. 1135 TaxID=1889262 RepID=UPI000A102C9B|nr:lysophospholipid acyltransferase family protein [Williamsia sp. 1135]ORM38134.1 1-acyl-sn-glycerol-3-phosphate acyltransferase [Williamsia sp. 1135]
MWYRILKYALVGPALRLTARPLVSGLQHVPRSGPVIIAANHLAVIDSFLLCLVINRRLTFLAKNDYFIRPGVLGALQRWFFTAAGRVPVDRAGGNAATGALDAATAILESGGVWAIHPEGTRSPDGHLHRGRTGVARVAAATGAPVIPVALQGTARVRPWRRAHITIGPPSDLHSNDIRACTDQLMMEIQEMSGQQYVDTYARR